MTDILSTPFFAQDIVVFLMGFGVGALISSLYQTPRWLLEELTK